MAGEEVADDFSPADVLVPGDRGGDRFVGRSEAAGVFEGDQGPGGHWSRVDHSAVARGQYRAVGGACQVDSPVAGAVRRRWWDEGSNDLVGVR
nr:hypothetical protein [Kibdelosporangium sp. MJ126-NF4]CTQ92080.1 hypothetical protein [Kibdelosporangium sp. MJ126-NF4]